MGGLEVNLVCARTCMQIAKSMLFLFLGGCCLKSSIRVRDREVDALSVLMGMFIGNGIGRGDFFFFCSDPLVCDREVDGLWDLL